ncbi:ABC transporter substrate-binding protein [Marinicrinis lubricantis]|uniref:ABC transporter substrate-binding protein n=1 Tax=Marinicrinis lubricantis TaxID=2086470 RepID=A0ABW1IP33_9BACL
MKKNIMIFVSVIGLLAVLAGCSSKEANKNNGEAAAGDEPLRKVSVMLDWYPNAVHSGLYAAIEQGYFAEQGLQIEVQMPADTNDPLRLVAAGKVDLALSYQMQVLMARAEGIPVQSLAALVRHPLNYLLVPTGSGIQSPKDLEGKTVGYPSIPTNEAIIQAIVTADGGDFSKVTMTDVGWDLIPALATGQVDALIGGYINHERILLEKEGHETLAINPVDYGVPDFYELVLAASEEGVGNDLDVYKKFWQAMIKGQQYVAEHPQEGLGILLAHEKSESPLDEEIEEKSLEILLPLMDAGERPFGYQDPASWQEAAQWLLDHGVIQQAVPSDEAFVNLVE